MSRRSKYRFFLLVMIFAGISGLGYYSVEYVKSTIPSQLKKREMEQQEIDFGWLITEEVLPELAQASSRAFSHGEYQISCKLFGVIPLKNVIVQVVETEHVYAGGIPIGLYMETQGVFVIDHGAVKGKDGLEYEPAKDVIRPGDYIVSVNGKPVREKEVLTQMIRSSRQGIVDLTIRRQGQIMELRLEAQENTEGDYMAGIWVRDNVQGIGTLTFLTEDQRFGALGHGINDVDTGHLLEISEGALYKTNILEIQKGTNGIPGEICGTIHYGSGNQYGLILENKAIGIFGTCLNEKLKKETESRLMEIGLKQEVKIGKAWIRSAVTGDMEDYEIEITDTDLGEHDINKGIVFRVTDERLLAYTGGIVQGMGVIDNRDNTKKPENKGFSTVTLKLPPTSVSDPHRHIRIDDPL